MIAAQPISPARRRIRACRGFLPDANDDGDAIVDFQRGLSGTVNRPIELVWNRLYADHWNPVADWLLPNAVRAARLLLAFALKMR